MENISFKFLYVDLQDNKDFTDWLMKVGLISDKYFCCVCGKAMKLSINKKINTGFEWRCYKRGINAHSIKRSIRKGTWFDGSKLSTKDIIILSYMWILKMTSNAIKADLKMGPNTLAEWKGKFRQICTEMCTRDNEMLGGPGVIVEIEEGVLEIAKPLKCKNSNESVKWVIGGIERGTENIFMTIQDKQNKNTLLNVITKYVKDGSIIISNSWEQYKCLEDEDYQNLQKNHSIQFKSPENGSNINLIDGTWARVKKSVGKHLKSQQFDSYLFEYIWRRKNKNCPNLIQKFLEAVIEIYPPATHD